MELYKYRIIASVNVDKKVEEVELYILDKYRTYTNSSNEDVYLCKDKKGDAYTVHPSNIIRFVY